MAILHNQRDSMRMPFVTKANCFVNDTAQNHQGTIRDISMTGLYMEIHDKPKVNSRCEVNIFIKGNHSRLVIEKLTGYIVREDDAGIAVRFDHRMEWFVLIPIYFRKIRDLEQFN
jgi:hypothetical protein